MINSRNVFRHELIGLNMEVIDSSNNDLIGLSGLIVDETKKTLVIEKKIDKSIKIIPKSIVLINVYLNNSSAVEINGKILVSRPEDRIKKKFKKI
ncbi:MAG: ribonuclease P protein subunit [Methanobrevibacter sp.]|jgi:ribonuclease P protein subunit POP4|nr:ribonuclease P protein subunit [Candidatus Methanoflexus mossambicus]